MLEQTDSNRGPRGKPSAVLTITGMSAGAFWSSFTAALKEICGQVRRYSEKSRKRMDYVSNLNKRKLKGDKVTVFNCSEG